MIRPESRSNGRPSARQNNTQNILSIAASFPAILWSIVSTLSGSWNTQKRFRNHGNQMVKKNGSPHAFFPWNHLFGGGDTPTINFGSSHFGIAVSSKPRTDVAPTISGVTSGKGSGDRRRNEISEATLLHTIWCVASMERDAYLNLVSLNSIRRERAWSRLSLSTFSVANGERGCPLSEQRGQ